jgi:hypothetical protein
MAISTFAELKTAIQSWSQRGSALSSVVGDFVALAEARIRADVRCRAMVQTVTGTLSGATLATPTRFLEAISVSVADQVIQYLSPQQFDLLTSQTHLYYTLRGDNFEFGKTGDYSISYYQAFAAFSADGDTNWLLTNYPGIYLFSGVAEAAVWTRDDPQTWNQRYRAEVANLENLERLAYRMPVVRPDIRVI